MFPVQVQLLTIALKGQCNDIFSFRLCSWIIHFPPPPPQGPKPLKIATGDTGGKFAAGVNETGSAPSWAANISADFRKNWKRPKWNTQGLEGNWFMKKIRSRKSRALSFSAIYTALCLTQLLLLLYITFTHYKSLRSISLFLIAWQTAPHDETPWTVGPRVGPRPALHQASTL